MTFRKDLVPSAALLKRAKKKALFLDCFTLKMKALGSFETSVNTRPRPRMYIAESVNRQIVLSSVCRSFRSLALRVLAIL